MGKTGSPWFPLYVDILKSDLRWALFKAEFGNKGFGIAVQLLMQIYQLGYYIEWTDEVALLFGSNIGEPSGNVVSEIINGMLRRGIFDRDLFDKFQILTSKDIQENYMKIVARRKNPKVKKEYLLIPVTQIPNNVNISDGNVNISAKNADIFGQSRKEKNRVEESTTNRSAVGSGSCGLSTDLFSLAQSIKGETLLTDNQKKRLEELAAEYGEVKTKKALQIMGDNIEVFRISYVKGILDNWEKCGKGANRQYNYTKKPIPNAEYNSERIMTNNTDYNDIYDIYDI